MKIRNDRSRLATYWRERADAAEAVAKRALRGASMRRFHNAAEEARRLRTLSLKAELRP